MSATFKLTPVIVSVAMFVLTITLVCGLSLLDGSIVITAYRRTGTTTYSTADDRSIFTAHVLPNGCAGTAAQRTAQYRPEIQGIGIHTGRQQQDDC
jgi:hypothetical protein